VGDRATAIQFYNQAVTAIGDKSNTTNATTAYQLFMSATYADPTYWQAHYQVGNNNSDLTHYEAAVASWRRALECELTDQERAKVYANLSQRLHTLGRVTEALPIAVQAANLDPKLGGAWINLSLIYGTLGNTRDSLAAAERAMELAPDDTTAQMVHAFALMFDGQIAKGLDAFECRYRHALHTFTQYPYPRWKGEAGKTLFLVADQGMGDTLSYARFVRRAAARCSFIHMAAHSELTRAFQYAFVDLNNIDIIPLHPNFRQADYWSTFVSLPFALRLTDDEIRNEPPVRLEPLAMNQSWKVPDRKFHVGVAWAGSPLNPINDLRSIPVTDFLELYRVPGIQLYGLQIGDRAKDIYDKGCAAVIRDLAPYVRDVTDTVSLLASLDLVICCESALTHVCAAIGKKCWIPYSYLGRDYRLGQSGEFRMWMPQARVFCQKEGETWQPVMQRVALALKEKLDV